MKRSACVRFALLFGALVTSAGHAGAYCRATTCDPLNPKQQCTTDAGCAVNGQPLRWTSGCVSFAVQEDGSPRRGIDADTVNTVSERAFAAWLGADCGDGAPALRVGSLGPVVCDESRYNQHGKNANIVMFRDDEWPYQNTADAYAMTIVRFDPNTGEIFDADIEVNSFGFNITTDGSAVGADLQSILTHEAGHFLGLGHSVEPDATMQAFWGGLGLDLRTLTPDDEAGICAAYPTHQAVTSSCSPRHGFSSECNVPIDEADSGCGLARPSRPGGTLPAFVLSALVGCLGALRRRSRASAKRQADAPHTTAPL